ncbi:helicase associated domain-containing protein [Curtobacterium sp. ISL-83]|uniref:helicase associated domain-containing protein n=1 Tax=Curtobacterium sp. ISL-83 TaxID=2819145 RepID=UPI0035ABDC62
MSAAHPFEAVRALHVEYEALRTQPIGSLSLDERRGLEYYLADVGDAEPGIAQSIRNWIEFAHGLDDFVCRHGRMPIPAARSPRPHTQEQCLVDRLSYQRRPAVRAAHCRYQELRLEGVPGFRWSPQRDRWTERLHQYQDFWATHDRAPHRRADDHLEASLGRWAAEQRAAHRSRGLQPERLRALRGATFRVL